MQLAKQQIKDGERILYEREAANYVLVRHRSPLNTYSLRGKNQAASDGPMSGDE